MSILYDFRPGSVSAKILTPEESEVSFAGSYEFTEADQQQTDALPKKLSTENDAEVTALLDKLKMSRDFEGYDTYMTKLTQAKADIDALYAEIESINVDIQEQIIPMTDPGLGEKSTVDRLVKRYKGAVRPRQRACPELGRRTFREGADGRSTKETCFLSSVAR